MKKGDPLRAARNITPTVSQPTNGVPGRVRQVFRASVSGVLASIQVYADRQIALRQIGRAI